jgi:type VI secretion system secreted protein VgrG
MAFSQENSILAVTTPFGADKLIVTRFHAEERLSALFRFDLEMVAMDRALDFTQIVGKGVTVKLTLSAKKFRYFHGIVGRFVQAGRAGKLTSYRAEVYPWFWLLTRTRDSRIFQEKSTPEIIEEIFGELGFSDFKNSLSGTYAKREYCVQYEESAWSFISRLMEDEGIYYFFKHEDGKHTLVLGDDIAQSPPCPDFPGAKYTGSVASGADERSVVDCTLEKRVVPGSFAMSDYNFETPSTSLLATADGEGGKLKIFEFPGNYAQKSDGEARAKVRIEAEEAVATRLAGKSLCRAFSAGHTFKLSDYDRDDANIDYVLKSVVHASTHESYSNIFEAMPKDVPFRPARTTQKPVVPGAQTALVVGKSGEEIWTDKYGRIKVQFYWDRKGAKDEKSSCFIRVAQGWAGKGWGSLFLPRIGQEVIVSFLSGDPDRPLITGSVYNAEQTVPYALPDQQTKSTILTRSTKEGSKGNEIRFEDKKDSEELYIHAQKDMKLEVENDWTITVKNDKTVNVKNKRSVTIEEGDESLTVSKGNRAVEVTKGNETYKVKGTRDVTVEGDETRVNKAAYTQKVTGDYTLKVTGNLLIDVTGTVTIKSGQDMTVKSGMALNTESGMDMTNKAGMNMTNKAAMQLVLDAGIKLSGKGGAAAEVEGGGMLTLKGGLVKIN